MRRLAVMWICTWFLAGSVAVLVPASSASAKPIAAGYRLHVDISGQGYTRELMTLLEDHTGYTDLDEIAWSRDSTNITLVFRNRLDHTYDAADYGKYIYGETPQPPLSASDAAWARPFVTSRSAVPAANE